jgi:hypothetical protein
MVIVLLEYVPLAKIIISPDDELLIAVCNCVTDDTFTVLWAFILDNAPYEKIKKMIKDLQKNLDFELTEIWAIF